MMTLTRIQRCRKPGWRKPHGALYVGRSSAWGNPFVVGYQIPISYRVMGEEYSIHQAISFGNRFSREDHLDYLIKRKAVPDKETAKRLFHALLADMAEFNPNLFDRLLKGLEGYKHLMCWCRPDEPCHADVWINILSHFETATTP